MNIFHLSSQDFDPEDFSSTLSEASEDGLDRQQLMGLMSSSHTPFILNRLNMVLDSEEGTSMIHFLWE